jgi:nitronate monooxygenase
LRKNRCDVIIAQGAEAGGHRAIFLEDNLSNQPGTFELLEAILTKVRVPVIAAGGIANANGVQAAISK